MNFEVREWGPVMAELIFLGSADAYASAGRGNSCYWVEDELGCFTVDFGPTALRQCQALGLDIGRLDGIYLTHLHGDHIGGIALLLLYLCFQERRTRPFFIVGPEGAQARIALQWQSFFPSLPDKLPFPVLWPVWRVEPGQIMEQTVEGRVARVIRAQHDRHAVATSFTLRSPQGPLLAFSGDTGWQPLLAELVRGAQVFICECSTVTPLTSEHLSLEEIARAREALQVGALWLSHMSAESRAQALLQREALRLEVGDDGVRLSIPAPA